MGARPSRQLAAHQLQSTTATNHLQSTTSKSNSCVLFDLLLLVSKNNGLPRTPLPCCWDELLDWTLHASHVTAAFYELHLLLPAVMTVGLIPSPAPTFVPFLCKASRERASDLPSMNWIQRAAFFAESVRFIYSTVATWFYVWCGLFTKQCV
jgi:hypothetical protein